MVSFVAGVVAAWMTVNAAQGVIPALPQADQPERITVTRELAKLPEQNWMYLTQEEMLEDFDYLYQTLEENYPYFSVGQRISGVGLRAGHDAARAEIAACKTDMQFFLALDKYLRQDGAQAGHLGILLPGSLKDYAAVYSQGLDAPEESPFVQAYTNERAQKSDEGFDKLFRPVWDRVMAGGASEGNVEETSANVVTKVIEPGKTAYVKIRAFDMMSYDEDEKQLLDFYRQVGSYENLIIDLSENGGGGMSYFNDLIAAPNIDKPLAFSFYSLFKDGAMNRKFMGIDEWITEKWCEKAEDFPQFASFDRGDLADVDYFIQTEMTLDPMAEGKKLFNGKIWMLVSGQVYSSSEWAAWISKATGFATLVGTQTGGDGIGSDPIPVVLPHSGLVVRYAPIYGVTGAGVGSEEYGTTPDLVSPEGETPLETCLKAIAQGK